MRALTFRVLPAVQVSDWRRRGLLRVRSTTVRGFVENGGQLDMRAADSPEVAAFDAFDEPQGAALANGPGGDKEGARGNRMPSNVWASPLWKDVVAAKRAMSAKTKDSKT